MSRPAAQFVAKSGRLVRVNGTVQGVGFRPTVWRIANDLGLTGEVKNDGNGVLISVWGDDDALDDFVHTLREQPPPLARIDAIEHGPLQGLAPMEFQIAASSGGESETGVAADTATCTACREDSLNPFSRRYRYPFTNCTHCGPRFSIIESIPYDRAMTTMRAFIQCPACQAEYEDPADRRFHAQPNACHACGPKATLERLDGRALCTENLTQLDDVDAACTLLQRGEIVAIKGIGGFHLACDAANEAAVKRLRTRKNRADRPFALMARDLDIVARYAKVTELEAVLLQSAEAPIVLLERAKVASAIAEDVAPRQSTLGFMLPYTPLHHLLLRRMDRPIVLTSGNLSDAPQCIANDEVKRRLSSVADYALWHNRDIVTRVDDSVVRISAGKARVLRRGRGYAPAALPLPPGFESAPDLLSLGGELKNTFCLLKAGKAILSQHMGDLEDAEVYVDYIDNLRRYAELFQHEPDAIVVDAHPEYLSSKFGRERAAKMSLPLLEVQHHHAHLAACLVDNNEALDAGPVLGVVLDGLGYSQENGQQELWGGEFLLGDYCKVERVGTFKPVGLLGGGQAMREPWRNTFAHLMAQMGWSQLEMNFAELELVEFLKRKPRDALMKMLAHNVATPLASSCGRLFDAVAAAVGICRSCVSYEGQAAIELEACIDRRALTEEDDTLAYPFTIPSLPGSGLPYVEPLAMWQAVLGDLILKTPVGIMSARFHKGLARVIVQIVRKTTRLDDEFHCRTVALSGGVFQNKTLLELVVERLLSDGYRVLTHAQVPANDGGLALGQAAIGAARHLRKGSTTCA